MRHLSFPKPKTLLDVRRHRPTATWPSAWVNSQVKIPSLPFGSSSLKNRPSQKEIHFLTIHFQVLWLLVWGRVTEQSFILSSLPRSFVPFCFQLRDDIMLADPNSYRFVWWEAPRGAHCGLAGDQKINRGTVMVFGWWQQDYSRHVVWLYWRS